MVGLPHEWEQHLLSIIQIEGTPSQFEQKTNKTLTLMKPWTNNHAIGPIIFSHTVLMRKKLNDNMKKWGGFPAKFVTSMKWNKWYDEENSWLSGRSGSDLGAPYVKLIPQLFFSPRSDFFVVFQWIWISELLSGKLTWLDGISPFLVQ